MMIPLTLDPVETSSTKGGVENPWAYARIWSSIELFSLHVRPSYCSRIIATQVKKWEFINFFVGDATALDVVDGVESDDEEVDSSDDMFDSGAS